MNPYNRNYSNGDRFFAVPFLTGALVGGAAIGLTRPRPVYVNPAPAYYPPAPYPAPPYYGTGYNYGNSGYYNYYR